MKILGLSNNQWKEMYIFYVFRERQEPSTIFQIYEFWHEQRIDSPIDCVRIASQYIEAANNVTDVTPLYKMLDRFSQKAAHGRL
ncbi:hypothetical protein E6Q11_01085 [Candidatus Dojkabacteria bacterium]|uniref:Uncharacterized protein n=1 Tax=Candidatus Dojkabacteria bacterium TaxID=2099670 RepID=A0A5C7JBL5_9BACT|nr:MAG: hypothetical protein E6Q11_01085 [Candidatus Dojkabacteria bacterium]